MLYTREKIRGIIEKARLTDEEICRAAYCILESNCLREKKYCPDLSSPRIIIKAQFAKILKEFEEES